MPGQIDKVFHALNEGKPSEMSHMLHSLSAPASPLSEGSRESATYQTNPNHPQHSNFARLRLTLRMLWFLRAPRMVRTAFFGLLLVTLVQICASAARINSVQTQAHATITKSAVHRAHRPAHPAASHSTLSHTAGMDRKSAGARASHTTARHSTHYTRSSSHRVAPSTGHAATLRHARYNRYHSGARFVPQATVPVASSRPGSETVNAAPEQPVDSAASLPVDPISEADPRSAKPPAESSATENGAPAETDIAPTLGTDRADTSAAGNPLAAPREAVQPIAPTSGQVAELHRPPIFSGRVSSYTLRGTHDSLVRQNARAEQDSLERIEDDADLRDRIARGSLVRVPESGALAVNPALPEDRRYCRPWTANFLTDLSRAHQAQFHSPLVVSSAVRTVEYQKQLMRTNHNAADAEGDIVSPHLTGATIDIAKSGLSRREMQWMRNQLLGYQNAGVLDVEEEFHQRCFHITVYKNYASASRSHRSAKVAPAPTAQESDSLGATGASEVTPNQQ